MPEITKAAKQIGPSIEPGIGHARLVRLDGLEHHAERRSGDAQCDEKPDDQYHSTKVEPGQSAHLHTEQLGRRQTGLRSRFTHVVDDSRIAADSVAGRSRRW